MQTTALLGFFTYLATGLGLLAAFLLIYARVTPHRELELIRQGNAAAAVSLGGAMLGFSLPLAQAILKSASLADMALWAFIALLAQLFCFLVARLAIGGLRGRMDEGNMASASLLAASSVATGLINAACMS